MSSKDILTILDALENLAAILDADSLDDIEVTENAQIIIQSRESVGEESNRVPAGINDETIQAIRQTFHVVYSYLRAFYEKTHSSGDTKRLVEGINTIMVLVGEAAKKLEKFSFLFKEKMEQIPEYRDLQNFYRNKVIKEAYREITKTPITMFSPFQEEKVEVDLSEFFDEESVLEESIYVLDDLDIVKKDTQYELFYLKNEDGRLFYTPDLARSIKLACDFGEFTKEYFGDDPLLQIKNWEDKSLQLFAKKLLQFSKRAIDNFYKEATQFKNTELVAQTQKCIMALILASYSRNLIRQFSAKGCHLYFTDFILFLRDALSSRDYQKFLTYGVPESTPFFGNLLDLIHTFSQGLFVLKSEHKEILEGVIQLIHRRGFEKEPLVSENLNKAYNNIHDELLNHPNGPLFKALDIIREDVAQGFDPLLQSNYPVNFGKIVREDDLETSLINMANPTTQEFIDRATLTEEFKAFLRSLGTKQDGYPLLIINLQDRTSWKEHARVIALEELNKMAEFAKTVQVVTLTKDTDFYHQLSGYDLLNSAEDFILQFKEHLSDESTGYLFPQSLKKVYTEDYMESLLKHVHETFFDSKESLVRKERLDFIEITTNFLILKAIDTLKPDHLAVVSKDGIDTAIPTSIELINFIKAIEGQKWSDEELNNMMLLLFGKPLMVRERVIMPERFHRMLGCIKKFEERAEGLHTHKQKWKMIVPQNLTVNLHLHTQTSD